ncbi:MAG: WD40/YVTN/BNR-like repeat-containing protein, partial [Bacteroidota bacterium]
IYRSADDGKKWERTLTGDLEARQIYSVKEGVIGLVEQDPPVRGIRERGLYLSADNGITWKPSGVRPPGAIYSMVVSGNNVYTVTSTGIYSSDNLGANWTPVNPATNKEDVFTTLISAR